MNGSPVLGDDSIANAETQTGSFADWFCCVERIENARSIFHAGSTVCELNA